MRRSVNYKDAISSVTAFVVTVISCTCFAQPAENVCGTNIIGVCGLNTPNGSLFCEGGFKRGWHFEVSGIENEKASRTNALNSFSSSDICVNRDSLASGHVSLIFTHELCIIEHKGSNCESHGHVTRIKNSNGFCLNQKSFTKRNHAVSYSFCEDFYRSPSQSANSISLPAVKNQRIRRDADPSLLTLSLILQNARIGVCGTDNGFLHLFCPGGYRRGWHFQVNPKMTQVIPYIFNNGLGQHFGRKCINEDSFLTGKILYIYTHEPCIVEHNGRNCEGNKAEVTWRNEGLVLIAYFLKGQKSFSLCHDIPGTIRNQATTPAMSDFTKNVTVRTSSGSGDDSIDDRQFGSGRGGSDDLEISGSADWHFASGSGNGNDLEVSSPGDWNFASGNGSGDDLEISSQSGRQFVSSSGDGDGLEVSAKGGGQFGSNSEDDDGFGSGDDDHLEIRAKVDRQLVSKMIGGDDLEKSTTDDRQLVSNSGDGDDLEINAKDDRDVRYGSGGGDDLEINAKDDRHVRYGSGGGDDLEMNGSGDRQFTSDNRDRDENDLGSSSTDTSAENSNSNPQTSSGSGFYFYSSSGNNSTEKVSPIDLLLNSTLSTVSVDVEPELPVIPEPEIPADSNQHPQNTGSSGSLPSWLLPWNWIPSIPSLPSFSGGGGNGHDAPSSSFDSSDPNEDDPRPSNAPSPSTKSPSSVTTSTESTTTQCECSCPSTAHPEQPTTHKPNSSCPATLDFIPLSHPRVKRQIWNTEFDNLMRGLDMELNIVKIRVNEANNPVHTYYYSDISYPVHFKLPRAIVARFRTESSNEQFHRTSFTGRDSDLQMEAMNARGYGADRSRPKDDKGHLVASRFSGPSELYNMVPQSPLLNRDFQMLGDMDWYRREELVAQWIRYAQCPLVQWSVFIHYAPFPDFVQQNFRPLGFTLEIKFYKPNLKLNSAFYAYEELIAMRITQYYSNQITCEIHN